LPEDVLACRVDTLQIQDNCCSATSDVRENFALGLVVTSVDLAFEE
jgi:hypothetical protein